MEEFLVNTTRKLKTGSYTSVTIVIGNGSCDLDSAVCSLVYALFLHWQHTALEDGVCTKRYRQGAESDHVFVPLLNVLREDFELKTEVSYCFREQGVPVEHLIFRDDFDYKDITSCKDTKVVLVDHHILAEEDKFLHEYVQEIVDHRPRDSKNWQYREDVRATIEQVGSCSTLVCQRIRSHDNSEEFFKAYPACAQFLYSAIILDTVNFSPQVKKGTPQDEEVATHLEEALAVTDSSSHRAATLARLAAARGDVSRLTAAQLLRKDVKLVGQVLMPSFPVLVKEVLSRARAGSALAEEAARRGCTAAVLLGMRLSGDSVERDLAVWGSDTDELATALVRCTGPCLKLVELPTEVAHCRYYRQDNLAASRKQIVPIVGQLSARSGSSV